MPEAFSASLSTFSSGLARPLAGGAGGMSPARRRAHNLGQLQWVRFIPVDGVTQREEYGRQDHCCALSVALTCGG